MLIGHLNDGKKGKQKEMEPSEILWVTEWLKEGTKGKLDWLQSGRGSLLSNIVEYWLNFNQSLEDFLICHCLK